MRGAAQFADSREADLTQAASSNPAALETVDPDLLRREHEEAPLTAIWILALAGVLMTNWYFNYRTS